jgi:hypothetical protein
MTKGEMRRHIAALTVGVPVRPVKKLFQATTVFSKGKIVEFLLPPVRSPLSYATALHEIGHWKSRHGRSRDEMVREQAAWRWARKNALIWTPAMSQLEKKSLAIHANPAREWSRAWKKKTDYQRITTLRRLAKQLRNNAGEAVTFEPELREQFAEYLEARIKTIKARMKRCGTS